MGTIRIAENIKYYRDFFGLTQEEFAKKIGVERTAITNYENGTRTPTLECAVKIAKCFNISLNNLVFSNNLNNDKLSDFYNPLSKYTEFISKNFSLKDSTSALVDDRFKNAYREHKLILNGIKKQKNYGDIDRVCEEYLAVWNESKTIEAVINTLSLLSLFFLAFLFNGNYFNMSKQCVSNGYINTKTLKDHYLVTGADKFDDIIQKYRKKIIEKYSPLFLDMLKELKQNPNWSDLADYYSIFYSCLNIDNEDIDRFDLFCEFLSLYEKMGNKYVKDFLATFDVTKCDNDREKIS